MKYNYEINENGDIVISKEEYLTLVDGHIFGSVLNVMVAENIVDDDVYNNILIFVAAIVANVKHDNVGSIIEDSELLTSEFVRSSDELRATLDALQSSEYEIATVLHTHSDTIH